MTHLRIKVNIGSFNVELEGSSEEVIPQFEALKNNGLGKIVDQLIPHFQTISHKTELLPEGTTAQEVTSVPADVSLANQEVSLQNIVYKQLPRSETEWVLVYGYFLDLEGKSAFERADLIHKYDESKRRSDIRMKNLSMSIKTAVKKRWISALNDKEFIVTDVGKATALEILSRQNGTVKPPKKRQVKREDKYEETPAGSGSQA